MKDYLSIEPESAIEKSNTNRDLGLTKEEVEKRKKEYGLNELPVAVISIVAPILAEGHFDMESLIDFGVIMAIVLIDAILETVQTIKARKSMDALKSLSKPKTVVLRDGQQFEIDASDLVPGDIVILEAGRYVPADLRIIESSELMIDEAVLTGESIPVKKSHLQIEQTNILAEMTNIAFMSTFTTNGRAVGIVIETGAGTEIAITLAIGVIPECLSAVVSITLSMSTKRMAKDNVIVKKLASVETLGSVNVICTDKTGTLTQNRMTVTKMIMDNKIVSGDSYAKEKSDNHMDLFLKSLVLCNDSVTEGKERIGDPTELALVDYAEKLG
ncbi:hypothetical protein FQR65_LT19909 [Abscondita terminalis]|nr:hypothetical protein FQR65_LT19909 [Abscondita terminalis]